MKKWYGVLVFGLMASVAVAQTNYVSYASIITNTACSAWNFVVDAKYLTEEERSNYNARANSAYELQRIGLGYNGVNLIRLEVETIEAMRSIQNCKTNLPVVWSGSPSVQYFNKVGSNEWESMYGRALNCFANPEIEIGFRSDGVVVWRNKAK